MERGVNVGEVCATRAHRAHLHERRHLVGVLAEAVEEEALEVRRDPDVHRRRDRLGDAVRRERVVALREEAVEDVVTVGRHHHLVDGEPHVLRVIPGEDVAKVAGRHGERHLLPRRRVARRRHAEVRVHVVHLLRQDARPVDRVDGGELVAVAERFVVERRLHDRLAVVEGAVQGDVVDVRVGHLGGESDAASENCAEALRKIARRAPRRRELRAEHARRRAP